MAGFNYGGASDNSGWSSENGNGPAPGGGMQGHAGDRDGKVNGSFETLKPGDRTTNAWGTITIDDQGRALMNGVVMTPENSSLVDDPHGGLTRVLNSLIDKPATIKHNNNVTNRVKLAIEKNIALELAGSWAAAGPVSSTVINNAIAEATNKNLPAGSAAVTSTRPYKTMLAALNALPPNLTGAGQDQINKAWKRAYDSMSDKIPQTRETGGKNGHTSTTYVDNTVKQKLAQGIPLVAEDIQKAVSQKRAADNAAKAAAQKAATDDAANAAKAREAAIKTATNTGKNLQIDAAQTQINTAATEANRLNQVSQSAATNASAIRQTADKAEAAANQADKAFNDLQNRVYGKTVKDGQYGNYHTRTTGGKNEKTTTSFVNSGVSVAQLDAARKRASDARQIANQRRAEVAAAEKVALIAAKSAYEAETKKQASQAAFKSAMATDEKNTLISASEKVVSFGEATSQYLSDEFKNVYKSVSENIKNFQGKKIQNYADALRSLEAITSNPRLKFSTKDKQAMVNAMKAVNAQQVANELSKISKAFKTADLALKINKIKEKAVEGYESGNWGPLLLEVEAMILSGVATGIAMAVLTYVLTAISIVGLPATLVTIAAILVFSIITSSIDARMAESFNSKIESLFN